MLTNPWHHRKHANTITSVIAAKQTVYFFFFNKITGAQLRHNDFRFLLIRRRKTIRKAERQRKDVSNLFNRL